MSLDPDRAFWNPEVELLGRDELQALQLERLRTQLAYEYSSSIYYREVFDRAGLRPEDVVTWDDFRRVPTMDKDDQRRAQEESIERFGHPYGMLACAPMAKIVRLSATSGTTGRPTLYTLTAHDVNVNRELHARKLWRGAARPGDVVLHAMALSMFTGGVPAVDAMQAFGLCVVPVGAESGAARVFQFIDLCRPQYLVCTPSFAEYLIEKCPEHLGKPATALGLKGVACGAEPGAGQRETAERIKAGFGVEHVWDGIGGAHVFHGYSCVAEPYSGMHLVSEDHCVLELLDLETHQPVPLDDGATGEMCYTYIDWEGTPLLRYRLGDVLRINAATCSCGDPRPRFAIIGRADDMLIVKGVNLYPAALKNALVPLRPRVTGEVRILLDEPGPRVEPPLRIRVEHGPEVAPSALPQLALAIGEHLHQQLRVRPAVELVPPGSLGRATHKSRLVEKLYEEAAATVVGGQTPPPETAAAASDLAAAIEDYLARAVSLDEFLFFCIARQGGRTAVEILARALIADGRHVYIGQNLTGARSLGTNSIVLRFADTPNLPRGISIERPSGLMFMHEALVWPDYGESSLIAQLRRPDAVLRTPSGVLMVCTATDPDRLRYPVPFTGTVATVDAEGIFSRRIGIQPAPSGITALGLYAAATGVVGLDALRQAVLGYDRLAPDLRRANLDCLEEAFREAKVARDIALPGLMSAAEYDELAVPRPSTVLLSAEQKGVATAWRELLPSCDEERCSCSVCLAAVHCPESVIRWRDGRIDFDLDFCKACGTCARECPPSAITMRPAAEVAGV